MNFAQVIVGLFAAYAAVGLLFAPFFVVRGVSRIDSSARGASVGFRLAIVPGVVALWPLLATRWARGVNEPPTERNAHRTAARAESINLREARR